MSVTCFNSSNALIKPSFSFKEYNPRPTQNCKKRKAGSGGDKPKPKKKLKQIDAGAKSTGIPAKHTPSSVAQSSTSRFEAIYGNGIVD